MMQVMYPIFEYEGEDYIADVSSVLTSNPAKYNCYSLSDKKHIYEYCHLIKAKRYVFGEEFDKILGKTLNQSIIVTDGNQNSGTCTIKNIYDIQNNLAPLILDDTSTFEYIFPKTAKPNKPSLQSIWMKTAENLSERSLDTRLKVGCVITDETMSHVLGVGYNGGAKGQSDEPESLEPGKSELIHAEIQALIKCNNTIPNKTVFLTHAPCKVCAKALVNSGVSKLYYKNVYRDDSGLQVLQKADIIVEKL